MTRVLVTGGSGFIASHILDVLLHRGFELITTVRSQEKARKIQEVFPDVPASKLDFRIVEDIAQTGAFDEAVKIPDLDAVIHTASPFHYNFSNVKRDLLDPAVNGTTGILRAIQKNAPTVKRVVITSSFAAMVNTSKGLWPEHTYSENDWNPVTAAQVEENPSHGYRASKTFAERAAWDFVEKEKPKFDIVTVNPPMVYGPVKPQLSSLANLNTSNQRVRDIVEGGLKDKESIPETTNFLWVDVRDLALAHVRAVEVAEAADSRFFLPAGIASNRQLLEIVREQFPEYEKELPARDVKGGGLPEGGVYGYDNSKAREILGIKFRSLEESVVDLVNSLKQLKA